MTALRFQNNPHPNGRVPSYYAGNKQYPGSYAPIQSQTRTSRRIHDGFSLTRNYGLDTTSDDINSSPYSSPYYINGRYNSDNLTTQRGNSASVQGIQRLLDAYSTKDDFSDSDVESYLELWQGKQIKFEVPYDGKVVGNTLTLKNTGGSTGILSVYLSTTENGAPIYETSIDLCDISQDKFEHREMYSITTIPATATPRKKLYVRMEIWDEIKLPPCDRSENPFNTGKKIQIAATGKGNHWACEYRLQDKSEMVTEAYDYKRYPSRPLLGLIYNNWVSVPTDRLDNIKTGATVSLNKYRYDIMCCKDNAEAKILIYDKEMNKFIDNDIKVDSRVEQLDIAQVTDTNKVTWVYYVDGYSPLQRFRIGEWRATDPFEPGSADSVVANIDEDTWFNSDLGNASGTYVFKYENGQWKYNDQVKDLATYGITLAGGNASEGATITVIYTVASGGAKNIESIQYVDARPVVGASLIMFHNNRLYLSGFRNDPNLVQVSSIEAEGPDFTQFPYRFYAPNRSPYDTSTNPITALTEYASDQIMISFRNGFSIYSTYGRGSAGLEGGMPTQVSTFVDASGVLSQGDIVNYKGTLYSFNEKEGIRQFNGALWRKLPTSIDSHYDRVDMTKPRKIWGFSNKLYFNYTDKLDGKYKCLIHDFEMNYQQYPWFQDVDIPFCDVRFDETEDLIGIHPDYPCVMKLYAEDTWHRLDSPIVFRRDSKFLSLPGNAGDIIVKRVHTKVIANSNRIWNISINDDKQFLLQFRGIDRWFRQPSWDTITAVEYNERPFAVEDPYEENSVYRMSITNLRIQCSAVQIRTMTKTFRSQANLVSTLVEVQPHQFI